MAGDARGRTTSRPAAGAAHSFAAVDPSAWAWAAAALPAAAMAAQAVALGAAIDQRWGTFVGLGAAGAAGLLAAVVLAPRRRSTSLELPSDR